MEDPTEPFESSMQTFSDAIGNQLASAAAGLAAGVARTVPPMTKFVDGGPIKVMAGIVPVSRELLYPTPAPPEEVARRTRDREEQAARLATRHAELMASPDPVVRAVAKLHDPEGNSWPECTGCDFDGPGGDRPQWPCRTWVLLDETVAAQCLT